SRGRQEELPHIVEAEQAAKEAAIPDQWIERGKECDGGRRLRRSFQQRDVLGEDEAFAVHSLDHDGDELAELDQLLAQRGPARVVRPPRIRLRGADAAEDVPGAGDAEQTVGAISGQELVAELLPQWQIARKQI